MKVRVRWMCAMTTILLWSWDKKNQFSGYFPSLVHYGFVNLASTGSIKEWIKYYTSGNEKLEKFDSYFISAMNHTEGLKDKLLQRWNHCHVNSDISAANIYKT